MTLEVQEVVIMKNGTEVSRLISRDSTMSFLTDSLVGVLKNDTGTDEKALKVVVAKKR